jgi:hypothetical protein
MQPLAAVQQYCWHAVCVMSWAGPSRVAAVALHQQALLDQQHLRHVGCEL